MTKTTTRNILTRSKSVFPQGFDIVIDATGNARIVEQCIQFTKHGAKIVIYGVCDEDTKISISPYELFAKELKIIASYCQTHCFGRAVKYLENGIVKVDKLVTHTYGLDDFDKALHTMMHEKQKIKVVRSSVRLSVKQKIKLDINFIWRNYV